MNQFSDARTQQVCREGYALNVPKAVARRSRWTIRLLLAARSIDDVTVIARIARFKSQPGRLGLLVEAKWFVTFQWEKDFGATEIRLERR